jgi:small subunit ribosomal protein S6
MNVECDQEVLKELELGFKFNDAVLRHLTVSMKAAVTESSFMMKDEKTKQIVGRPAPASDDKASPTPAPVAEVTKTSEEVKAEPEVKEGA